jgi:hypothetical protein
MFEVLILKSIFMLSQVIASVVFSEGGIGMYFILIALLLALFFVAMAFVKKKKSAEEASRMIRLASESSLIALVSGILASILGVIQLFDVIESLGDVAPDIFGAGIKVSLLTATFGLFSFVIARIGILAFKWSDNTSAAQ